jgi:hypothetical protein
MHTATQANDLLRRVVFSWGIVGTIIIPLFVFIDLFGGWRWAPYNAIYDQMIVSIYFVLGVFLLLASRNPHQHRSLLWFTVWSSVAHGLVMLFHALAHPGNLGHLIGDVNILVGAAALAWALYTNPDPSQSTREAGTPTKR